MNPEIVETNLRNYCKAGDLEAVRTLLNQSCPDFDINGTGPEGLSALFIALRQGLLASNPGIIQLLLDKGAEILNGPIISPSKTPKRLTSHAGAKNLETIFQRLFARFTGSIQRGLFLEIGCGEGYLKYLLSLRNTPTVKQLINRIIETEAAKEIVAHCARHGKDVIHAGISDLDRLFGGHCISGVISMNVLDTFSMADLVDNLKQIAKVLQPGGFIIHIMSSAIHEHLFSELQEKYPDQLLLPYYQDGHVGLTVVSKNNPVTGRFQIPPVHARYWCELFSQNPAQFVEIANIISQYNTGRAVREPSILFKNYSMEKIRTALRLAGFELLDQDELTSRVIVAQEECHREFPEVNCFHNMLGAMVLDNLSPVEIKAGEVLESSTYAWIAGRVV